MEKEARELQLHHCGQVWPVLEEWPLKPDKVNQDLKAQIVVYSQCLAGHCQVKHLHGWYGLQKDGKKTGIKQLKPREFDQEWLHRLGRDAMDLDQQTRMLMHVGEYTLRVHRPAEIALHYLKKLFKSQGTVWDTLRSLREAEKVE